MTTATDIAQLWVEQNKADYFSNGIDFVYHWVESHKVWEELWTSSFYQKVSPGLMLIAGFKEISPKDRHIIVTSIIGLLSNPLAMESINRLAGGYISMSDGKIFILTTKELRQRTRDDYITYGTAIKYIGQQQLGSYTVERFFSSYISAEEQLDTLRQELRSLIAAPFSATIPHVHFWGGNGKNGRQLLVYIIGSIVGKSLAATSTLTPSITLCYLHEVMTIETLRKVVFDSNIKNFIISCMASTTEGTEFNPPYLSGPNSSPSLYTTKFYFPNTFSLVPNNGQQPAISMDTLKTWIDAHISDITTWILNIDNVSIAQPLETPTLPPFNPIISTEEINDVECHQLIPLKGVVVATTISEKIISKDETNDDQQQRSPVDITSS